MKRRTFLNWAGIGLLATYFPVALAACSRTNSDREADPAGDRNTTGTTTATDVSNQDFLSMGTVEELQSKDSLLNEESKIIVVKNSNGKLIALNPTCTHRGCTVNWETETNTFVCPCHQAKYAPDGKVLAQPATEPLATYEVKQENGEILVKVS